MQNAVYFLRMGNSAIEGRKSFSEARKFERHALACAAISICVEQFPAVDVERVIKDTLYDYDNLADADKGRVRKNISLMHYFVRHWQAHTVTEEEKASFLSAANVDIAPDKCPSVIAWSNAHQKAERDAEKARKEETAKVAAQTPAPTPVDETPVEGEGEVISPLTLAIRELRAMLDSEMSAEEALDLLELATEIDTVINNRVTVPESVAA